ncbi:eCIS core domain-containing protein [Aliikangiella coralliicola]|uniref:DUF4157 domain-containing protein n=1 Tax=Aliikangiella coralliicola TaxID=2592383 RepID=A0A545UE60_9GAMM|nr:DUF4157 domain-containing protein [Aliikangiella coralliicola]TQV87767.1 DUF4157 domain-containing protein [Aliikangiella coralliicola]
MNKNVCQNKQASRGNNVRKVFARQHKTRRLIMGNRNRADKFEQQADRSANAFVRGEQNISSHLSPVEPSALTVSASRAEFLPSTLQNDLESAFATDLSAIRVHRDFVANNVVDNMNARAFASGSHIYFGSHQFDPTGIAGQRLLAHEIAHSIQQTGRVTQVSNYRQRVTDIQGSGIPQCWSIPLETTPNLPDIEAVLKYHDDNAPAGKIKTLINRLLINHRQAIRDKKIPEFWNARANHVVDNTNDPVFALKFSDITDIEVLSALYDGLKRADHFSTAAKILNQFPDVKTTYFSAETYNHLIELNITKLQPIKDHFYKLWYTSAWFGRATPRFMLDRTFAFLMNPAAKLSRQIIDSTQKLTEDTAEKELKRRHDFNAKENELYFMTVLIASEIEEYRYDLLREAYNETRFAPEFNFKNRAHLKASILKTLEKKLIKHNADKRARVSTFLAKKDRAHTFGKKEISIEAELLIIDDFLTAVARMVKFAYGFWTAGYDVRKIANHVDFKDLALDGIQVIKILNKYAPGLYAAINTFVFGILEREGNNGLLEPVAFDLKRKKLIKDFTKGVIKTQDKIKLPGVNKIERNLADKFFDALPTNKDGRRNFSFDTKIAEKRLPTAVQGVVAWGFIIAQELLEKAKDFNLTKDKQISKSQKSFDANASAADIREIYRLRFAEKINNISQSVGWNDWSMLAENVIHGHEISSEAIYFASDWKKDEIAQVGVIRADFSNRKGESIGGIEPLGKQDLFTFLMAEDYRQTSRYINKELENKEGDYPLIGEPLLNEAVKKARKDYRPERYLITEFDWVRPYKIEKGQIKNKNITPSWVLIGQHPLTRKRFSERNAQVPQKLYWMANRTYDRQRKKFICVLWLIPSPINLLERIQQIDAVNDLLISRLQLILDPKNQKKFSNINELLKHLPPIQNELKSGTGFKDGTKDSVKKNATVETITREQLKALKLEVWWKILDFVKASLFFISDPKFLKMLRNAITSTDLIKKLKQEREDAFKQLRLDERKALSHERRRHIETRLRPALENYKDTSFDKYRIPGDKGVTIKRLLAEEVASRLSFLIFRIGNAEEREGHTALAVLEMAETIKDKLGGEDSLNVIHDWLPLIDVAVAWTQDTKKGGDVQFRETYVVREEEGKGNLYNERVNHLKDVLKNMTKVLREKIMEWGIIGTPGDGTVENTGHIHAKGRESRKMGRGYSFTINGISWEVLEVKKKFRFHPAAFPLKSSLSNSGSVAGSILFIDGKEYSKGATRPNTLLMYIRRDDSVNPLPVYADKHEWILTDLTWAAHMQATVAQLQDLAEAIEFAGKLVLDLAEFFPVAGQAVAATRLIGAATQLMKSDLPKMMDDLVKNPHELLKKVQLQLEARLSVDNLVQYLIFSNDNNIGLKISENKPKPLRGGGTSSRRWRRLARKLQRIVAGVTRIFARVQDNVQDRRQGVEHLVQNSPHASFIIAFIADHYHEVLGVLSRLNQISGYTDFLSAKNSFSEKDIKEKMDKMIGKMGSLELPADILPLEEIIHALIDIVGHRLGGKYKLGIRILLALLDAVGATDKIVGGISNLIKSAFAKATGGSTITDTILPVWRKKIVPKIETEINKGQKTVADVLEELFGFFNIDLDLAEPEAKIRLRGNEFPSADPNEGPMSQPSLESDVKTGLKQSGLSSLDQSQTGQLLNRLPGLGGEPLSDQFKKDIEARFGQDFSDVRIHHSTAFTDMMKAIQANALTSGSHIFMSDRLNGDSETKRVLYHELAHVVQQTGARPLGKKNTRMPKLGTSRKGIKFDPKAEAEADAVAAAAMKGDARPVTLSPNSVGVQPSMIELFGIRFLRQLTDIGSIEDEVADIDSSGTTNDGRLIGRDVRHAVAGVGARLKAIFASPSKNGGLTIKKSMTKKFHTQYAQIKKQLQASQATIDNAIEDIAIRASFIARPARNGKPPTMGLDVGDFTRRLERYILGKTGILLDLGASVTGRGSKKRFKDTRKPYKWARIRFVFLPAIHGNNKLWKDLLKKKFPSETDEVRGRWRRNLRAVLRDLGTSVSVWDDNYQLKNNVYTAAEKLGELKSAPGLDASSLPPKNDYLNTDTEDVTPGGIGNIRLHLGTYEQKTKQQKGRERESHHITQYLLVQYFHNGSSGSPPPADQNIKGFPLAEKHPDAYPGLEVDANNRPTKFLGSKTVEISELEDGRGKKMPTILLARPTHRRGNLHINPKADDFEGTNISTQGAALNHVYTNLLPGTLKKKEQEVAAGNAPYSDWKKLIKNKESTVKGQIYRAMQGTYKYMRNYMQGQLKKGLVTNEKNYYNDLFATKNPSSTEKPMKTKDMEDIWAKAVSHNNQGRKGYKGMSKYGWVGS